MINAPACVFICGGQLWVTRAPPNHHRRHSAERTPIGGEWEREGRGEGEKERVILSSHVGICVQTIGYPHVLQHRRARYSTPEYMTRSTRINWHYGYDVVSLATVTRLLPLSTTPRRFVPLLTVTCPFPIFNTTNMTMHNALAILPAAEREKKRRFIIKASIF